MAANVLDITSLADQTRFVDKADALSKIWPSFDSTANEAYRCQAIEFKIDMYCVFLQQ